MIRKATNENLIRSIGDSRTDDAEFGSVQPWQCRWIHWRSPCWIIVIWTLDCYFTVSHDIDAIEIKTGCGNFHCFEFQKCEPPLSINIHRNNRIIFNILFLMTRIGITGIHNNRRSNRIPKEIVHIILMNIRNIPNVKSPSMTSLLWLKPSSSGSFRPHSSSPSRRGGTNTHPPSPSHHYMIPFHSRPCLLFRQLFRGWFHIKE
mmetsp:Transcript_17861/g.27350  ORF Transcript_17861/g.27350 Transcript_17861/m.27350 type:complete len:204 (+) Transcript_17861:1234-1845(+)